MILRPYLRLSVAFLVVNGVLAQGHQSPASSSKTQSTQPSPSATRAGKSNAAPDSSTYQNAEFGFRYKTILGWVDRTQDMQSPAGNDGRSGKVLLAVFERPPEVQSETINPAVVIAQESVASYPGLKDAADFVGTLTQLVTARGFKPDGDPAEVTIDGRSLVQCDFKRDDAKRPAFQSTLILVQKGSIVSFTFIAATQEDVDALVERLSFQRPPAKTK